MTETDPIPDIALGAWVYCRSHVRPHTTGWCTVPVRDKLPLEAQTSEAAFAEVKQLGLPICGYCEICYATLPYASYALKCAWHDKKPAERDAGERREELYWWLVRRSRSGPWNAPAIVERSGLYVGITRGLERCRADLHALQQAGRVARTGHLWHAVAI